MPGFKAGVEAAHDRFGKLPFSALFEPAIYLAEHGFALLSGLAGTIKFRRDVLSRWPETKGGLQSRMASFIKPGIFSNSLNWPKR